jgi:dTDP-4-dehydrorhamnose 3,5-epimerase
MQFEPTHLPGVIIIQPHVFADERGFFLESWQREKFAVNGIDVSFVQDNHSHSVQHTLRGLHYQLGTPQGKLVRVVHGAVFDVAVDIRRSSPTLGQWVGVELSAENHRMLWVPEGFAHGFLALTETASFLYKCTTYWDANAERAIAWNDPDIGIRWPLPAGAAPRLSPKDAAAVAFRDAQYLS